MEKNTRIRVDIMGRGFNLISGENVEHVLCIAKKVDSKMRELKSENSGLTYETAAVLTSLNFCDEMCIMQKEKKNNEEENEITDESNRIRSQLVEYSKELSKATNTIKKLEREVQLIKKESHDKEERIKHEYEVKEKEILDMLDSM